MTWVHRTLIISAAEVGLARRLCGDIPPGDSGKGMFEVGLSPTGLAPATHYISTGWVQDQFAALMTSAPTVHGQCQVRPSLQDVLLTQVQVMLAAATIVSDADPHSTIAGLGLKLIKST